MKFFLFFTLILILNLNAQEQKLDIKFFGTLGAVYNNNSDYVFRKSPFEKKGSSNDLNYFTDSILGAQTTYKFNDDLSLIAQGIAKQDYYGDKKASLDWGYLKYDSNENFIFKIGRIRTPYYKNSNNNNIGYSKLMIREPIEVYGQIPLNAYNGIEFIYSNLINKYFYTIQANYGRETFDTPLYSRDEILTTKIDNVSAINFTFGNDFVETRATYLYGKSTTIGNSLNQLFSFLRQNNLSELADKYELKNKTSQYFGLGLFVNYNNLIFSSEYGKRNVAGFYAGLSGFYSTLGYKISSFTPYVSYAETRMDKEVSLTNIAPLDDLLKKQNLSQESKTIGFKYHINENLDFKFEYQRITPKGEYGGFYIDPTNKYPNSKSNVYSFVLDFVF